MNDTFWSVMIPVYNRITYLEKAIESVLAAARNSSKKFQICVVDNCSDGNDIERIVRNYSPDVKLWRNEWNVGMFGNWNRCVELSTGEWIHILHDDDLASPQLYVEFERIIEKTPKTAAVFCPSQLIDGDGRSLGRTAAFCESAGYVYQFAELLAQYDPVPSPGAVISRNAYRELGCFREDIRFAADWEYWFRVALHYPVAATPLPLTSYRIHRLSATASMENDAATLEEFIQLEDEFGNRLRQTGIRPSRKRRPKSQARGHALNLAWRAACQGRLSHALKIQIRLIWMYCQMRDLLQFAFLIRAYFRHQRTETSA